MRFGRGLSGGRDRTFSHTARRLPALAGYGGVALLTAVCVVWLDRPLARVIARAFPPDQTLPDAPDLLMAFVAGISILALLAWPWARRHGHHRLERLAPLIAVGAPLALGLKDLSKWAFGRTEARMALSTHGYAGFHHWFHGYPPFMSFPSGHMLVVTALLALVTAVYPRVRPLAVLLLAALAAALLITSYHFLGDILAGWLFGRLFAVLILRADAALRPEAALRTPT